MAVHEAPTEATDFYDQALRLAARLAGARALAEAVEAVTVDGAAMVGAARAVLTRLRGDELEILGSSGYEQELLHHWHRFSVTDEVPLAQCVRRAETIDVLTADMPTRYPAVDRLDGSTRLMAMPLVIEGRVVGALGLGFTPDGAAAADPARTRALAILAAAAVDRLDRGRIVTADRQTLLEEASRTAAASLDPAATLAQVLALVVPEVADGCTVHRLEDDGRLVLEAVTHADGDREQALWSLGSRYGDVVAPVLHRVCGSGESVLLGPVRDELLVDLARDEEHLALLRRTGIEGGIVVQLRARGRCVGALSLLMGGSGRVCTEGDVLFAEDLASRVALALDNARLYAAARDASSQGQRLVAMLDTLLWRAPIGLGFFDHDARFIRLNDRLAEINGLPIEAHLGRTVPEILQGLPPGVDEDIRRVAQTGEAIVEREVAGETPAAPGVLRHWIVSYYPVQPPGGEVFAVGVIVVEISDRIRVEEERTRALEEAEAARAAAERNERRVSFLAEASAFLTTTLSSEEVLRRAARLAVSSLDGVPFADFCTVDVLEDGELRRVAALAADRRLGSEVARILAEAPASPASRIVHAVRTGTAEFGDMTDELLARIAPTEERQAALRSLGARSYVVAPLVARGRVLGALMLTSVRPNQYGPDDLRLAVDLAARAALAVDNGRLYESRSEVARALQAALLPPALPSVAGLETAACYHPSSAAYEVGGDFYDVFPLGPDRWAFIIGDICGTGPEAASRTSLVRHTARAVAASEAGPAAVLSRLNGALLAEGNASRFCTVAYAEVTLGDTAGIRVASAGHPLPVVVRRDGEVALAECKGQLLGVLDDPSFCELDLTLEPGDGVVFYTDGVLEARGSDGFFDDDRMLSALRIAAGSGADAMVAVLEDAVLRFAGGRMSDDTAVLALSVPVTKP